jgi:WD40 repeat protein
MAGCKDRAYLWKATEEYKAVTVLQGCSGLVTHATFSSNGQYLMCNSSDSEIVVWEVTGKRVLKLSAVRDEVWYDWSLIYGWQISGAWNKGDIESACANPCSSMLAVGDTTGNLRLYQYPCTGAKTVSKDAHAHTAPVQEIKWAGDTTLISAGGADQTLALWTCVL